MAIYKNREVAVISPMHTARPPQTIIVQYKDGTHENVSLGLVQFTKEEKDSLVRNYPSEFDSVKIASDDDLKAVRLGTTPPSDPDFQRQAEEKVRLEKAQEENRKNLEKARKDAEDKVNKEYQSQSTPATVTSSSPTEAYQAESKKAKK